MRSDSADRTTAAVIRDCAMTLFAARGTSGVTVRDIAAAAGVSPGLVMHHYGSKEGLREAVDRHAARFVEELHDEMTRVGEQGGSASLAALFSDHLEREPALVDYVRRLLCDGAAAADALFARLFDATLTGVRAMVGAGLLRPATDDPGRAAFLLVNDLAVILLRHQIAAATGFDPLTREGMRRWTAEVADAYTNGVFAKPVPATAPADQPPKEQR